MRKILLLEDNTIDSELIKKELSIQRPDWELCVVNKIEKARTQINETQYDIALFDINLPDGNGIDLLVELRENKIKIPIIVLTAGGTEELVLAALKAGASNYIPKKLGYYKIVAEQIDYTVSRAIQNSQLISVLYIEHHSNDYDLTSRHLRKHAQHINLTKAIDSQDALNLLPISNDLPCKYDVLMLDYKLPGLNALEISKIIRHDRQLSIAIVIVTGQGNESVALEALKIGVDDFIVKRKNYLLSLPYVLTSAYQRRELVRQQKILKQSETKFRLLADYAADWEFWVNPQGEYIYNSPACKKISGYLPEAFEKNKNLLIEIASPEYKELVDAHFARDRSEPTKSLEFIIISADGEKKWISHVCTGVYDENGNYHGQRGINKDISEQKKHELELIQSNERFIRLFEDLGDAVFVTKIGGPRMGEILEVNPAATKQTGYTKKELLQMNIIRDLFVEGSDELTMDEWDAKLQAGKFVSTTERKRKKDGTEYWTEVIVTPIEFNGEKASLSINRDITEHKRAELIQQIILNISNASQENKTLEETLKFIQSELGRLINTENFLVALTNNGTNNVHVVYYQDKKDEIKDFSIEKTLTDLVLKKGEPMLILKEQAKKLEENGVIGQIGFDAETWLGIPLKIKRKITGILVIQSYTNPKAYTVKDKEVLEIISHQISLSIERKQEEEKLRIALDAAQESDRMKTAFLANMSHELRTPLNAVIGFSALLDRQTNPDDIEEFSQLIQKSGLNLLEIVDEIFQVTLIERGEIGLDKSQKPVLPFLNELFEIVLIKQKNFKNNSVHIQLEIQSIDNELALYTDFNKLKQIMLSLLNNALKFTHKGAILFGLSSPVQDNKFLFYVKDTGIGIPKEKQNKIFERFQIIDDSRTRAYSGIGMGLFITRQLVNLLGGEIWLESTEGEGTTFYFTVPRDEKK
jgi:PAS domain S-box-containing protein